ncbi:TlpA disulfide reductase family protein [Aurantimonas sp. 22II-16-19i]|uniref:TlpA family protein disulfide reductase n=1 Tax=Aurantimonas sp. 22II-16-19i TaxID=1317114 RepID=UPI0009F7A3FA|nr:TlpA disulfide reductase family protein [Aurantimonas sp. 22II-16-19i]ORE89871.1 peroxiredoxin-like protein [Aurantimonas sp. 22II-16-19i]
MRRLTDMLRAIALRAGLALCPLAAAALAAMPAQAETVRAAMVTVGDGSGRSHTLAALMHGQPTILHVWATWCVPCRDELPAVDRFAAGLGAGIRDRLIAVSVDTRPHADIAAFLAELDASHLRPWQVTDGNAGTAFRLFGYPATLLVAADGTVVERFAGPVDWDDPAVAMRFEAFVKVDQTSGLGD